MCKLVFANTIALENLAKDQSFKGTIYTAIDIYRNRKLYAEINEQPLAFGTLKKER